MTPPMEERRALLDDPDVAALIAREAAATGDPVSAYEAYLIADPRPGVTWADTVHARLEALRGGPIGEELTREIRRMVADTRRRNAA